MRDNLFGGSLLRSVLIVGLIAVIIVPKCVSGANVLFFFGLSTYSHRITAWPLAVQLAEKGHSVTFLQSVVNKNPHPKVKDVIPKNVNHPLPPNFLELRVENGRSLVYYMVHMLPLLGANMCTQFLNDTENIAWVNSQKFDLVIIDALFNDCGYGLAHKWNAKTMVFSTTHLFEWFPDVFGFPDESATQPSIHFASDLPITFLNRVKASLSYLYLYFSREWRSIWTIDKMLREKLNMPDMPPVSDLVRNTSLVLLNTHFSEEFPRSLPPFLVPVGGMHVTDQVKPLPEEMEKFVKSGGDNGFIYISFGSEADMSKAPVHIKEIFYSAVRKSKGKFLWRWIGERPKDMPANVYTSTWMPQQDILGHPKCKGFLTHGGLLSMQEAVNHGVPMIVLPIFAEQDYNAERLHRTGRGIRLEFSTLTQAQLDDAFHKFLTDPSFKRNMKLAQTRFKDRPEKPANTALWWTEYILRHEDTSFLRPLAISLTWYQRRQLDVWAFNFATVLLLVYLIKKILGFFFGLCCGGSSSSKKTVVTKSKKKN